MLRKHHINGLDNFIGGWYIDQKLCDLLIEYHKNCPDKYEGLSGMYVVDKNIKDSIDCIIDDDELIKKYYKELQKCVDLYIEKYPKCNIGDPWTTLETGSLQHYLPGGGYYAWHSERIRASLPRSNRHLVFMTYLNTVTDRGETEFFHQRIKINPEKGLTIIWPADWTFTHRGIPSPTQEKYIYTGWFNYYKKDIDK